MPPARKSTSIQIRFDGEIPRRNGIYYCPIFNSDSDPDSGCSYSSKVKMSVESHIQFKHSDQKPFSCPLCDYRCKTRSALHSHTRIHTGEKPFLCKIPGCSYASAQSGHLLEHEKTVHSTSWSFPCSSPGCKFAAKTKSRLQSHKKIHAGTEFQAKKYMCPDPSCSYEAKRKEHMENHILCLHCDERPFKCPLTWPSGKCGYSGKTKNNLNLHMKIHVEGPAGKKSCSFPGCQYKTRQSGHLNVHERRHLGTGNWFKCSYCPRRFEGKTGRNDHERSEHSITRENWFACHFCDYKSARFGCLTVHIRKHTRETPYKCGECGKSGYHSAFLNYHKSMHERSRIRQNQKMVNKSSSFATAAGVGTRAGTVEFYTCPNFTRRGKCTFSSSCLKDIALHLDKLHKLPRVQLALSIPF